MDTLGLRKYFSNWGVIMYNYTLENGRDRGLDTWKF